MITLGEGNTPLVALPRLASELGLRELHGKLESANPTGSYKDRIAARSMDEALAQGANGWIATSSGNGTTSFAACGRRAGVPGVLCVTETITREKLLPDGELAAGLRDDVRAGRTGSGDSALLVLTGSGLQDLATVERALDPPPLTSLDSLPGAIAEWAP